MDITARFWSKVRIGSKSSCWPWVGAVHKSGYGHFRYKDDVVYSHRVSFFFTKGGIKPWTGESVGARGVLVVHSCDNRLCCNPAHLSLGTQKRNLREASERKRLPRGAENNKTRLTHGQVAEIKAAARSGRMNQGKVGRLWSGSDERHDSPVTMQDFANRFNVRTSTVYLVLSGKTWREDGDPPGLSWRFRLRE